jgi:hypothetical protein
VLHAVGASAEQHGGMMKAELGVLVLQSLHIKECEDTWRPLRVTSDVDKIVTNRSVVSRSPG